QETDPETGMVRLYEKAFDPTKMKVVYEDPYKPLVTAQVKAIATGAHYNSNTPDGEPYHSPDEVPVTMYQAFVVNPSNPEQKLYLLGVESVSPPLSPHLTIPPEQIKPDYR